MIALWAFLRRDTRIESGYRFALVQTFLEVGFAAAVYYFIGQLIAGAAETEFGQGSYFGFAVIGLALTAFLDASILQLARVFRSEQSMGTLDALLATPVALPTVLLGSALWPYTLVTMQAATYLVVALIVGVDFGRANWLGGVLVVLLATSCFACLGIMEAGIGIVVKRGNPLGWALSAFSALVGGAYFPVTLLPEWLRWLSIIHPLSHATHGARAALLGGATLGELAPEVLFLGAFNLVGVPTSLWVFAWAVRVARVDGTLAHA